jgi:hypothetical protein
MTALEKSIINPSYFISHTFSLYNIVDVLLFTENYAGLRDIIKN